MLSMAHMDYQMEFEKRKKAKNKKEACHRLALIERAGREQNVKKEN